MTLVQGPFYEVTVTEYERGWGQRPCPDMTLVFTDRKQAEQYAKECERGSEEIYWRAEIQQFG